MLYPLRTTLQRVFRTAASRPALADAPSLKGHIPALDAIRGLAIVLVTLYRFGGGSEDGPARALDDHSLVELGARGVDLFFVLSGFLITGILLDAKGKPHYFRNFYVRRALRIFPLYYGVLALTLLVLPRLAPSLASSFWPAIDRQTWLWLYGANVLQAYEGTCYLGPLNHFWSLAIEEHYYFAWPAVICFTSRPVAMRLCGGLFAASIVARICWLTAGGNDVAAEVLTPLRMDGLVLGSWLALAARGTDGLSWLLRLALPALVISGIPALAADVFGRRLIGLPDAAWACTFAALLVLVVAAPRRSWLGCLGRSRLLQFFGKYSYAMYVFQLPLVYLLAPVVTAPSLAASFRSAWLGQAVYCGLLFALTTAVALASWHGYEKHWLALKRCFG
jgi:peptidoglycan/LPS O-acetylase OafA/YrhL